MQNQRWSEDETILALYLYLQLPFGKLHSGNPEIQHLAKLIGRSNSSVAMKLANFASLDPKITQSGRKGLDGASKLDREVFSRFCENWTSLVDKAERLMEQNNIEHSPTQLKESRATFKWSDVDRSSSVQRQTEQRLGQSFFRRAVLANFDECCCITGIADSRLLNASHIIPWGTDSKNRHNPANGLSLSATFDRAFDRGLLTILPTGFVEISIQLLEASSAETRAHFRPYQGKKIKDALRFNPDPFLLAWHNKEQFVGS